MPIQDTEQQSTDSGRLALEQERRWGASQGLFRKQALEHYHRRQPIEGRLLRLLPRWLPLTFRLLLAMMLASLVFCAVVRVGEFAEADAVVVETGDNGTTIAALFSVQDLPKLEVEMAMRLEISGYGHLRFEPRIAEIDERPLTREAMAQVLGTTASKTRPPVVRATARLPSDSFTIGDENYRFAQGMAARARVRLRDEPILLVLVPALRPWWPGAFNAHSASDVDGRG